METISGIKRQREKGKSEPMIKVSVTEKGTQIFIRACGNQNKEGRFIHINLD